MGCFNVTELAHEAHCSTALIREYINRGFLPVDDQVSSMGPFDEEDLARIEFIHRCRSLEFEFEEIQVLISIIDRPPEVGLDFETLVSRHLEKIHDQVVHLSEVETVLHEMVSLAQSSGTVQPLLDALNKVQQSPRSDRRL